MIFIILFSVFAGHHFALMLVNIFDGNWDDVLLSFLFMLMNVAFLIYSLQKFLGGVL